MSKPPELPSFGYPDGYRDPDWHGTEAQFRDKVFPARAAALQQSLSDAFKDVLPEEMRWEWVNGEWRLGLRIFPRSSMTCRRISGKR